MNYYIKDLSFLRKILWLDTFLGGSTAILGLCFFPSLTSILGLTTNLIVIISIITLLYSIVAFILSNQQTISISLLRTLVFANWVWTIISIGLLLTHFDNAKTLGLLFLILQILVVGGLAYLEGNQIIKKRI